MVRLAVEELIERLDITVEVLKDSDKAGAESLIEAVVLCKEILRHYVKPFSLQSPEALKKHMTEIDKP
jgi:glycerol-3-phosphate O-acyltransferase